MTGRDEGRQARARLVLWELWRAYQQVAETRQVACAPGCHVCCSGRVLLTTLEARLLAEELTASGQRGLLALAARAPAAFGPACTHNALARLCLAGQEPPPDPGPDPGPGPEGRCPLLRGGLCVAYAARPMACRVMCSLTRCQPGGAASQDPWWVTVDTVFLQLVEQVDAGGGWGPMPRVLASLERGGGPGLARCENLPGLPVPPEDQERLSRLLEQVFSRPLNGQPLGLWINRLRI
ncbi:MAG: hypothetical protein HY910_14575 [Desulfarculus sp.]|nr:hypothetical protein [Desulfarculus sp.]